MRAVRFTHKMRSRLLISSLLLILASSVLIGAEKSGGTGEKASAGKAPVKKVAKKSATIGGVAWSNQVEDAFAKAKKTGKPVLVLQMFGDLDDAFC